MWISDYNNRMRQNSIWIHCSLLNPSHNIMQCINVFYRMASFFSLRFLDFSLLEKLTMEKNYLTTLLPYGRNWNLKKVFSACRYTYVLNGSIQYLVEEVGMGTTCSSKSCNVFHKKLSSLHLNPERLS